MEPFGMFWNQFKYKLNNLNQIKNASLDLFCSNHIRCKKVFNSEINFFALFKKKVFRLINYKRKQHLNSRV